MKRFVQLFLVAATVSFATSCSDKTAQEGNSAANADSIAAKVDSVASPKVASVDSATLVQRAKEILQFAAKKEYAKIADYIHPTKGIRFSPYTYVDTAEHKHFTAAEFREQVEKNAKKKVLWGTSDPLGEDILLTVEGYFKEFGYDKKYLEEGSFGFNQVIGSSTVINNIEEAYPGATFVEAYWVPKDEEKAPYEWGSVRLVFEEVNGQSYLVGWIHDAWST
jgi:hypothetical protein